MRERNKPSVVVTKLQEDHLIASLRNNPGAARSPSLHKDFWEKVTEELDKLGEKREYQDWIKTWLDAKRRIRAKVKAFGRSNLQGYHLGIVEVMLLTNDLREADIPTPEQVKEKMNALKLMALTKKRAITSVGATSTEDNQPTKRRRTKGSATASCSTNKSNANENETDLTPKKGVMGPPTTPSPSTVISLGIKAYSNDFEVAMSKGFKFLEDSWQDRSHAEQTARESVLVSVSEIEDHFETMLSIVQELPNRIANAIESVMNQGEEKDVGKSGEEGKGTMNGNRDSGVE